MVQEEGGLLYDDDEIWKQGLYNDLFFSPYMCRHSSGLWRKNEDTWSLHPCSL